MSINETDLKRVQVESISTIQRPLTYHFDRFVLFEQSANPERTKKWESLSDVERRVYFDGQKFIKYEVEAYISKLGKFARFCFELSKELGIKRPEQEPLSEVWDSLRDGGVIKELRDKWTAHRSYDKPEKNDTEHLHLEVLLNLEGPVTFWIGEHFILEFQKFSFDLCDYHPKLITFLEWFFDQVNSTLRDTAEPESENN